MPRLRQPRTSSSAMQGARTTFEDLSGSNKFWGAASFQSSAGLEFGDSGLGFTVRQLIDDSCYLKDLGSAPYYNPWYRARIYTFSAAPGPTVLLSCYATHPGADLCPTVFQAQPGLEQIHRTDVEDPTKPYIPTR